MTQPSQPNPVPVIRILGRMGSPLRCVIRDFVYRSEVPFGWVDLVDDEDARTRAGISSLRDSRLPRTAGLSAAVYGASDGLVTVQVGSSAVGGPDLLRDNQPLPGGRLDRNPYDLGTNMPRILAASDVRHGAVKPCLSAEGERAMAVAFVHRYLAGAFQRDSGRLVDGGLQLLTLVIQKRIANCNGKQIRRSKDSWHGTCKFNLKKNSNPPNKRESMAKQQSPEH